VRPAQVMKNVVLAGVGQVTLMDECAVADAAPGNFLVPCDADPSLTCAPLRRVPTLASVGMDAMLVALRLYPQPMRPESSL
jgi:hypothetical protein